MRDHVSGQLKVAPEHCSSNVLKYMGKPDVKVYDKFREKYFKLSREAGLEQYLVPYLMSSHPGSTLNDAIELALYLKEVGCNPEQVQDFYPTPGTASTVMYYTGIDPLTMKNVYAPDDYREKLMQRALLQYRRPENRNLVREALIKAGREDLIGYAPSCLVAPDGRIGNGKKMRNGGEPPQAGAKKNARGDKKKSEQNEAGARDPRRSGGEAPAGKPRASTGGKLKQSNGVKSKSAKGNKSNTPHSKNGVAAKGKKKRK